MSHFGRIFLFTLLYIPSTFCQDASTGAIRGTVSDVSGGRIAGANVVFVNSATGMRYSETTAIDGRFAFELVPPEDYLGRAESTGMSPQITPHLHVDVGGATELEFKLPVAGAKESVAVSGEPQLVETQPSAISSAIDQRAISDLPLNGRRYTDLALLTSGVTQDPRGLTSASNGEIWLSAAFAVISPATSSMAETTITPFLLKPGGATALHISSAMKWCRSSGFPPTLMAELGRAGGAVVNVVTKSGSNQIHRTEFYFLRDSALAAQHPFMDFKPHDQQQQFGFTLGGRIRAFFFAGFDQHIFHIPRVVRFVDGSSVVQPLRGAGPVTPGDFEDMDRALVFSTAQLSKQAGTYASSMLGNAGFLKLDIALNQHNNLSARVSTSRYYGHNNVFLDPARPAQHIRHQRQWRGRCAHRNRLCRSYQQHLISRTQPPACAVLPRPTGIHQQHGRATHENLRHN